MLTKDNLIVTTSWDDGTVTDLKLVELLEKYGIKGTFYISRSYLYDLLQEQDIVAIGKKIEIGAHTLSHSDLTKIPPSEAEKQIEGSKTYLEDLVGHSVSMFCYPYGRYNELVKRMVRSSGFIAARTCEPGGFNLPQDPYQWHISLITTNGSSLVAVRTLWKFHLWKVSALLDWESRAKLLFDLALQRGGIYHIHGHSAEFEENNEWDKLESVFNYISNREGVRYMINREIMNLDKEV